MITYRTMTEADIPAGLALCRSAGWNQLENDWRIFIEQSKYGNIVAVNEKYEVVGTAATITYDDRFSWIGMVLVDPSMKRQGIGTRLLRETFELLRNQETIKLDATPAGREIYLKLGFEDEYGLSRLIRTERETERERGRESSVFSIEELDEEKFDRILLSDKIVFGASREELLRTYFRFFRDLCFYKSPASFCFGRSGHNFTQIGPVIAESLTDAIELVKTALERIEVPIALDVMDNSPFRDWLLSNGFTEQRKLIRMYRGKNAHPGIPEKQFAILGPEFG